MSASIDRIATNKKKSISNWSDSLTFFTFALLLFALVIILFARLNSLTFPLPNEDDARFFFPAWTLATYNTLSTPILNAPYGMFWVPHGFYIWLAIFLRLFGTTVEVARTTCQVTTATAAVLLILAYSRLCGSRSFALLCGLLLVSPGVIFAANMLRMESLILLIYAIGLLLHSLQYRPAAAAFLFLSIVVHPALIVGATLYLAGILYADIVFLRYLKKTHVEKLGQYLNGSDFQKMSTLGYAVNIVMIAAVAAAIILQTVYTLHHLPTFHQHMAYQMLRKANRNPIQMLFLTKRGLIFLGELLFTICAISMLHRSLYRWLMFVRNALPIFLLSLGLSLYAALGREIPYNVYTYVVVPATFCCLTYRLISYFDLQGPFSSTQTSLHSSTAPSSALLK